MKKPSSPSVQRRTDPGRPELGKPVWPLDLAIRIHQTGFKIQGQELFREEKRLCSVERLFKKLVSKSKEIEWRVEKRDLIVIQIVLGSVVSVSHLLLTRTLTSTFEICIMREMFLVRTLTPIMSLFLELERVVC